MSTDTTRDKILAAASDVFAVKGFDKTTVRDICTRADVNVAAVNYHFRDKQNLFQEVLSSWMETFVEDIGLREVVESGRSPQEKLRAYIHAELSYVCKANDPVGSKLNKIRIIFHEFTNEKRRPETFCHHKDLEERILYPVIREMVGENVPPEIANEVRFAAGSLTTHYFLRALDENISALKTQKDLDNTADFLTTFALGGLNAIKEKYNA